MYIIYQAKDSDKVKHIRKGKAWANKQRTHLCAKAKISRKEARDLDRDENLPARFLDKPPRWFSYQNMLVKQAVDQTGHFVWSSLAVLVGALATLHSGLGWGLAFIIMHAVAQAYREYTQWPPRYWWDFCLDVLVFAVPYVLAYMYWDILIEVL